MTSCKEAIKDLEVDGKVAAEMEEIRLCPISNMKPLIPKMDASLSALKKCKQLRLVSRLAPSHILPPASLVPKSAGGRALRATAVRLPPTQSAPPPPVQRARTWSAPRASDAALAPAAV